MRPEPPGSENPYGSAWRAVPRLLRRESEAQRLTGASAARTWKIVNPDVLNEFGDPVGYRLVPGATATMLADPSSSVGRRALFARRNLWVTPHAPDELDAAGDYPNQHPGGDGLPKWTSSDRSLERDRCGDLAHVRGDP